MKCIPKHIMVSPLKIKTAPYYLMTNGLPYQNVSAVSSSTVLKPQVYRSITWTTLASFLLPATAMELSFDHPSPSYTPPTSTLLAGTSSSLVKTCKISASSPTASSDRKASTKVLRWILPMRCSTPKRPHLPTVSTRQSL